VRLYTRSDRTYSPCEAPKRVAGGKCASRLTTQVSGGALDQVPGTASSQRKIQCCQLTTEDAVLLRVRSFLRCLEGELAERK